MLSLQEKLFSVTTLIEMLLCSFRQAILALRRMVTTKRMVYNIVVPDTKTELVVTQNIPPVIGEHIITPTPVIQ